MEATPLAPMGLPPPTSLISSSSDLLIFLKKEYGIKLVIVPPSMSIHEIGMPSRCPHIYNSFKWFSKFFGL
jgi:hypothetical protein